MGNAQKPATRARMKQLREEQSREKELRETPWTPANRLPTPNPSDGWAFRWIRVSMNNEDDAKNVSYRLREGWIPVKRSEHPELMVMSDVNSRFPDNIQEGGLLLCKTPIERMRSREAYLAQMTQAQMTSVDQNLLRQNDPLGMYASSGGA